eukprot:280001_1
MTNSSTSETPLTSDAGVFLSSLHAVCLRNLVPQGKNWHPSTSVDCASQLELWVSVPQDGEEEAYKKGNNTLGSCNAYADKSSLNDLSPLVTCPAVQYSLNPSWVFPSSAVMHSSGIGMTAAVARFCLKKCLQQHF